jgi:hypothetical protein
MATLKEAHLAVPVTMTEQELTGEQLLGPNSFRWKNRRLPVLRTGLQPQRFSQSQQYWIFDTPTTTPQRRY